MESAFPEMPCVGPDGQPAGFWVEAGQFRALRRLAYIEMERQRDARPVGPSVWGDAGPPDWVKEGRTPAEVLERMAERTDRGGERREAA